LNVCDPLLSVFDVNGLVHDAQAPESTAHSKVAPVVSLVKLNDGVLFGSVAAGFAVMVVLGAFTANVYEAGVASVLPLLLARTWKVCEPRARSVRLRGLVQAAHAAASSLHSKVAPLASDVNVKEAVRAVIAAAGFVPIVVSGVETVHESDAGVSSASLAELRALTRKV
jgi:hypothetical protein